MYNARRGDARAGCPAVGPAMHLILTHEQADFDGTAALLAARLLQPQALAVLPRRLNRNVRAFLTLYGDALPFIDPDDVPRGPIERVTLVDTQSMPSIKGATSRTQVHIVDHHPPAAQRDPAWTADLQALGSTTTLLVEALLEASLTPDMVGATLLLMGIYEDTGSLTYAGTTSRDLLACAWLLEQGASLAIADDFLNHPLSAEQRRLYDRLLDSAETHTFHGLSIVIACGSAEGMQDEISTLAHKLRDLFDPAGLFVIVALNGTVQLVARSTSDAVDVARLAEHFGGGGHNRAAAALIRGRRPEEVRDELLTVLETAIRPARTVGEIMSREPQLLAPSVRVSEAAERMQRFGHEGYPVVENGRVVGLLTRRAVDRAMSHAMGGRPVSSVMEAGGVVVSPADSVQHLQRVMIQHDWGQVPVADPEGGEIIGIVTRTDLLRTLAAEATGSRPASLAPRLEAALAPERLALLRMAARQAEAQGDAIYIVGGFVRDLVLGLPSLDFDLVVEGDAIALARGLAAAFGGRVSSHTRFGTAKWHVDVRHAGLLRAVGSGRSAQPDLPASLDLVSARTEFYAHPTALPSVQRGSIKLDLHRRDFTINTLALRLDGRHYGDLLDPWGGGRDLHDRLIRVLHSISFIDDPTRMLRAARLEQRLGFTIDPRTLELMHQAMPLLDRVSGERLRDELGSILDEACTGQILTRLHALGLLSAIHPALEWDAWLDARLAEARAFEPPEAWQLQEPPRAERMLYALWLVRLDANQVAAVCDRLHFSLAARAVVVDANRLTHAVPRWPAGIAPSDVVARLDDAREESLVAAWLALADVPQAREILTSYLVTWRRVAPATDGRALRDAGLPPGPAYGQILATLRAAWLDGQLENANQERELLQTLLAQGPTHG
jgi:tRNA nucleotidyltransferase (CCA-adding enzyme)